MKILKYGLPGLAILISAQGVSQAFINGDFEGGTMTGWNIATTTNGTYKFHAVVPFDMNDAEPGGVSLAARFSVGQITNESNIYRGITVTQNLLLEAGTTYRFSHDWAARNYFVFDNFDGGKFNLIVDGASIAEADTMNIFTMTTEYGKLEGFFTATETRQYSIGSQITRRFPIPPGSELILGQYIDNFQVEAVPEPSSICLLVGGIGVLAARRRKRAL
ncbi:MAG: PEP-CTERM sorting domain-containing protein [Fimbriimonadaceae bacterium]|nr:PEP-CTERM sorting domain-containing protein [Fimbriimonadaceae bacterium]